MNYLFLLLFLLVNTVQSNAQSDKLQIQVGGGLFFRESFVGQWGTSNASMKKHFTKRIFVSLQYDNNYSSSMDESFRETVNNPMTEKGVTRTMDERIRSMKGWEPYFLVEWGDTRYRWWAIGLGVDIVKRKKIDFGISGAIAHIKSSELLAKVRSLEYALPSLTILDYSIAYSPYHGTNLGGQFTIGGNYSVTERVFFSSKFSYTIIPIGDGNDIPNYTVFLNQRFGIGIRI